MNASGKDVGVDPEPEQIEIPRYELLDLFRRQIRYLEEFIPKPQDKDKKLTFICSQIEAREQIIIIFYYFYLNLFFPAYWLPTKIMLLPQLHIILQMRKKINKVNYTVKTNFIIWCLLFMH
jgi:hypothetical protein